MSARPTRRSAGRDAGRDDAWRLPTWFPTDPLVPGWPRCSHRSRFISTLAKYSPRTVALGRQASRACCLSTDYWQLGRYRAASGSSPGSAAQRWPPSGVTRAGPGAAAAAITVRLDPTAEHRRPSRAYTLAAISASIYSFGFSGDRDARTNWPQAGRAAAAGTPTASSAAACRCPPVPAAAAHVCARWAAANCLAPCLFRPTTINLA